MELEKNSIALANINVQSYFLVPSIAMLILINRGKTTEKTRLRIIFYYFFLLIQIDKKYEFSRNQLIIEETLGEGEFGKVVSAKALNFRGKSGLEKLFFYSGIEGRVFPPLKYIIRQQWGG